MIMNKEFHFEVQPQEGLMIDALRELASLDEWQSLLVVAAYATRAGIELFSAEMAQVWSGWATARKRYVFSFDFGLTEPGAVVAAQRQPNGFCRIHQARITLDRQLDPETTFHPKAFVFSTGVDVEYGSAFAGLIGSANLTRGALTSNVEAGVSFFLPESSATTREAQTQLLSLQRLYEGADDVDGDLIERYRKLRPKALHRPHRQAESRPPSGDQTVSDEQNTALASAMFFWTAAGNIAKNRGHGRPGNQIDLTPGARSFFFGVSAPVRPELNTEIGSVTMLYESQDFVCNLRFNKNGMDKLNLPIPGESAPTTYDNMFLLWERLPDEKFGLSVESDGSVWLAASTREGTVFSYGHRSARVWGYFNQPIRTRAYRQK
jgi:hypothetical protein